MVRVTLSLIREILAGGLVRPPPGAYRRTRIDDTSPSTVSGILDVSEFSDILGRMDDVDVFSAIANPIRRQLLVRLRRGPRTAGDLASGFDIGRPAVSEHLQVLRRARLVREEPRGRERYYHLDPRPLSDVEAWVREISRYWKQQLEALDAVLNDETKP